MKRTIKEKKHLLRR